MICENCGKDIGKAREVCPNCGAKLPEVSSEYDEIMKAFESKASKFVTEQTGAKGDSFDGVVVKDGVMDVGESAAAPQENGLDAGFSDSVFSGKDSQGAGAFKKAGKSGEDTDSVFSKENEAAGRGTGETPEERRVSEDVSRQNISNLAASRTRIKEVELNGSGDEDYSDDELLNEKINRRSFSDSGYSADLDYGKNSTKDAAPKKKKIKLVIITIMIVLAVCAAVFLVLKIFYPSNSESEEDKRTDVITCGGAEDGGTYKAPLQITLASREGNRIYYSLNGVNPTMSSAMYTGGITLSESYLDGDSTEIILKAVSYSSTSIKTGELELTFSLVRADVTAPVISPDGGSFTSKTEITIEAEDGATVYYTYDGTAPTTDSEKYTGPIEMKRGSHVLSAIAVKNGKESAISTCLFKLTLKEQLTYEEAAEAVLDELKDKGYILNDKGDTEDGGTLQCSSGGTFEDTQEDGGDTSGDGDVYYVVIVQKFTSEGKPDRGEDVLYYGVDNQNGDIVKLKHTSKGYSLEEE